MKKPNAAPNTATLLKQFTQRLQTAIDNHPQKMAGRGQQKWLREELEKVGAKVTAEAVSRWFAAESKPRAAIMSSIARVLKVDEAWLSLGLKPGLSPDDRQARNATASGAVNLVAGLLQMNGANIAFLSPKDPRADDVHMYAIMRGKQLAVHVALAEPTEGDGLRFSVPNAEDELVVLGVHYLTGMRFEIIRLNTAWAAKHSTRRGGYNEITMRRDGTDYKTKADKWPRLRGLDDLA